MGKKIILVFSVFVFTGFSGKLQLEAEGPNLKAVFIYNFTQYIEWSDSTLANEFIIGVMGASPVSGALSEIARTKKVNNKKIIVRKFNAPEEISFCHILFIPSNFSYPLNSILKNVSVKGTLIVSEKSGFASQGTAINFINVNNNLKFEANTKVIRSEGLKASSQLLKLAVLIEPEF